jgi:hypothetical protein
VRIKDINGRETTTQHFENQVIGNNLIRLNTEKNPNEIYLVQVDANRFLSGAIKMIKQ